MLFKLLAFAAIIYICRCYFGVKSDKRAGVSMAIPHWCPTNVQCDEYMRERVKRAIRQYAQMESTPLSIYRFNEQYALQMLEHKRERMKDDKALSDEWHRVFSLEFRDARTYMQLAHREKRPLDYYLK